MQFPYPFLPSLTPITDIHRRSSANKNVYIYTEYLQDINLYNIECAFANHTNPCKFWYFSLPFGSWESLDCKVSFSSKSQNYKLTVFSSLHLGKTDLETPQIYICLPSHSFFSIGSRVWLSLHCRPSFPEQRRFSPLHDKAGSGAWMRWESTFPEPPPSPYTLEWSRRNMGPHRASNSLYFLSSSLTMLKNCIFMMI